jgi:hypothetical protein
VEAAIDPRLVRGALEVAAIFAVDLVHLIPLRPPPVPSHFGLIEPSAHQDL